MRESSATNIACPSRAFESDVTLHALLDRVFSRSFFPAAARYSAPARQQAVEEAATPGMTRPKRKAAEKAGETLRRALDESEDVAADGAADDPAEVRTARSLPHYG